MNIGKKIQTLKESMNFKDYQEMGRAIGLSGDWIKDSLSKKETVTTVDITRLIKIADYFHVTLDYLLKDDDDKWVVNITNDLPEDDIGVMLDKIIFEVSSKHKFYGKSLNDFNSNLIKDSLNIIKQLINDNL